MKKASAPTEPATPKPKRNKAFGMALCVILVGLVFLLKFAFLFFLFAMLPSLVAYVTDRHPQKISFYVVVCCNLSGALPYLSNLYHHATAQEMQNMLGNAQVWLVVYAAASLGWLLNWMAPYAAQFFLEMAHASEAERCRSAQKKMAEDWGAGIRNANED